MWSRDPIHLSSEGYQRLASCLVDELQHPQVQLERLTTGHRTSNETKKRKGWTHKSDMTASRDRRDNLPWRARLRGDAADYRGGAGCSRGPGRARKWVPYAGRKKSH